MCTLKQDSLLEDTLLLSYLVQYENPFRIDYWERIQEKR